MCMHTVCFTFDRVTLYDAYQKCHCGHICHTYTLHYCTVSVPTIEIDLHPNMNHMQQSQMCMPIPTCNSYMQQHETAHVRQT